MGLFSKKEKTEIPPVETGRPAQPPQESSGRGKLFKGKSSNSSIPPPNQQQPPYQVGGGNQARNYANGGYNAYSNYQQPNSYQQQPNYGGGNYGSGYGMNDPYQEQQRNKLFAGAQAPTNAGPDLNNLDEAMKQDQEQMGEDEEVEAIKQQMGFTKQESLASTRNALRIARQTEETAARTLETLGEQSERIANTGNHLDNAKALNARAEDEAREIKTLNRSIFRPTIQFNKKAKRDAEQARLLARHIEEREEREASRMEARKARDRVENTFKKAGESQGGKRNNENARLAERSKYQFEATESDNEIEDEIDSNLDELSGVAGRLKLMAVGTGETIRDQNEKLNQVGDKVDKLDVKLVANTQRLANLK